MATSSRARSMLTGMPRSSRIAAPPNPFVSPAPPPPVTSPIPQPVYSNPEGQIRKAPIEPPQDLIRKAPIEPPQAGTTNPFSSMALTMGPTFRSQNRLSPAVLPSLGIEGLRALLSGQPLPGPGQPPPGLGQFPQGLGQFPPAAMPQAPLQVQGMVSPGVGVPNLDNPEGPRPTMGQQYVQAVPPMQTYDPQAMAKRVLEMSVNRIPADLSYDSNGDGRITAADALAVSRGWQRPGDQITVGVGPLPGPGQPPPGLGQFPQGLGQPLQGPLQGFGPQDPMLLDMMYRGPSLTPDQRMAQQQLRMDKERQMAASQAQALMNRGQQPFPMNNQPMPMGPQDSIGPGGLVGMFEMSQQQQRMQQPLGPQNPFGSGGLAGMLGVPQQRMQPSALGMTPPGASQFPFGMPQQQMPPSPLGMTAPGGYQFPPGGNAFAGPMSQQPFQGSQQNTGNAFAGPMTQQPTQTPPQSAFGFGGPTQQAQGSNNQQSSRPGLF